MLASLYFHNINIFTHFSALNLLASLFFLPWALDFEIQILYIYTIKYEYLNFNNNWRFYNEQTKFNDFSISNCIKNR